MKNIPLSVEEYCQIMSPAFGEDFVKNCFENRNLLFTLYKHAYSSFYYYYEDNIREHPESIKDYIERFNNYHKVAKILKEDAEHKNRYLDTRLISDISHTGVTKKEDIIYLADLFFKLNDRAETYGSCYNEFYISEHTANIALQCREVADWLAPVIFSVPQEIVGDRLGDPKKLFDACKAWKISKNIWKKEAVMIGKMSLEARVVAGAIIDKMRTESDQETVKKNSHHYYQSEERLKIEAWVKDKKLRTEFWQRFSEAQKMGWDKAIELYCDDNPAAQIHLLAQKAYRARSSSEEFTYIKQHLPITKLFKKANIFSLQQKVMNLLVKISAQEAGISLEVAKKFRQPDAPEKIKQFVSANQDWLIPASFNGLAIFREKFPDYLRMILNHNKNNPEDALSIHDALYWLPEPMNKEENKHFAEFIKKNIIYQNSENKLCYRPLNELQIIAQNWKALENKLREQGKNIEELKYKDILSICMSAKYKDQRNDLFATEAARHGTPAENYHECEDIYLAGLKVPEPFDSTKRFKLGKYTGRFLPRDDVRTGFFGGYTDCCQHFRGAGDSCAVSTIKDPFSQLFVIEDDTGKIIAGSWTWENTEGKYREVCFDNIESLGELQNRPEINRIYEQVGEYLTQEQNCRRVTIGLGYQDADTSKYESTDAIRLPKLYGNHYTDAHSQVLLAENPNAEPLDKTKESQRYIRDVCYLDIPAMQKVSEQCFPDSDKKLVPPENMSGFVLEDREKGIVGYCLYDAEEKWIYDMAVLPAYRTDENSSSRKLLSAMMRVIKKEGGEWHAEMRDKTTFRFLETMAERGLVKFEKQGIDHTMSDGSEVIAVTFTPIDDKVREATRRLRKKIVTQTDTPLSPSEASIPVLPPQNSRE